MNTKIILSGIFIMLFVLACTTNTPTPTDGNPELPDEATEQESIPTTTPPQQDVQVEQEVIPESLPDESEAKETGQQAEEEQSLSGFTITAEKKDNTIILSWNPYEGEFKSYKIIKSTTDPRPRYPGSDLLATISNINKTTYTDDSPEPGINYYAVAVLYGVNEKKTSNVVSFEFPDPKEKAGNEIDFNIEKANNAAVLSWTIYDGTDLLYYKIVKSETNPMPKYPNDNSIAAIANASQTNYLDYSVKPGIKYFYAVTVVRKDGTRYTSNPMEFFFS